MAAFLVDRESRIMRANPSGREMIENGMIVRQVNDKFVATDPNANAILKEALAAAQVGDDVPLAGFVARGLSLPRSGSRVESLRPLQDFQCPARTHRYHHHVPKT
jgi:hypothetical protein